MHKNNSSLNRDESSLYHPCAKIIEPPRGSCRFKPAKVTKVYARSIGFLLTAKGNKVFAKSKGFLLTAKATKVYEKSKGFNRKGQ